MREYFRNGIKWTGFVFAMLFASTSASAGPTLQQVPVLIIGGGVAGLATAYHLKKAGIDFKLLELTPRLGGRARTATYSDGAAAEVGLEEFWEGNPMLDIFRELQIPLEKSATSFSSVILDGKIHPFVQDSNVDFLRSVLTPSELKAYQSWDSQVAEIYKKLQKLPISAELLKLKDVSFEKWASDRKFGLSKRTLQFIRSESEPEYGTSWSRISALDGIAEWQIFSGRGHGSFHVVAGNQSFVDVLAAKVGRERILLNTQVTNINQKADHAEVVAIDTATSEQKVFRAESVVSTIPLFRLNEIQFSPALPQKRQEAIQSQGWGAYFTAHVAVAPEAARYWESLGTDVLPILTGSTLGVIYEGKSPTGSRERLLNLLITGDYGEAFNARTMSFDQVGAQIRSGFEALWPGFSKHILRMTFYRQHPRAIAGWPVGRSRFDSLSDLMRQPEGRLFFAGDFTEGTHSDDAARSALRVVAQIRERRATGSRQ